MGDWSLTSDYLLLSGFLHHSTENDTEDCQTNILIDMDERTGYKWKTDRESIPDTRDGVPSDGLQGKPSHRTHRIPLQERYSRERQLVGDEVS